MSSQTAKLNDTACKAMATAQVAKNQIAQSIKRKLNDGSEVTEVGVVLSVIVIVGVIAMTPLGQQAAATFTSVKDILTSHGTSSLG